MADNRLANSATISPIVDAPLISIVLATYNGAKYLRPQLDSLVRQTWRNIEIVVTDDGSVDGTASLLHEFAAVDARFRIFVGQPNVGYVLNFERGMLHARGEFVALCDQDDIWQSTKLDVLMQARGDHVMAYSDSELIDATAAPLGRRLSQIRRFTDFDDCLNYAVGGSVHGNTMLFARDLVQECVPFPPSIPHDYWLGFVATFHSAIHYVDQPLVLYRQHPDNVFGAGKAATVTSLKWRRRRIRPSGDATRTAARARMQTLYEKCPAELLEQKAVYRALVDSYASFSLPNNFRRMMLFFRYGRRILAYKRRSAPRRWLFALKMFFVLR